ncbi:MAG: cellulase family glycosylhydrolase, partial [Candidatus Bipolaricaulia bacterium]
MATVSLSICVASTWTPNYYSYLWDAAAPWTYATQADIQYLASLGVTAIRLGLHWRYFNTPMGYALIDTYLDWCEQAGIYVILDMHVVPPEDDVLEGKMWDNPAAQQQFLDLWTAIAAIRAVDSSHILFIEV